MSFQAYLDTIQAKTGQPPQAIADAVRGQGLSKPGEVVAWLKREYGLGHGHAMAIVALNRRAEGPARSADDRIGAHFTGAKARWRPAFDRLLSEAKSFGPDVSVSPAASYLSLVKAGRKFAIVQVGAQRLDLGLKLKGVEPAGRLEPAGAWNAMVTHRVRITSDADIDAELMGWLKQAWVSTGAGT